MTETERSKNLPHNPDAETHVLGGILLQPRAFVEVLELVGPSDFYHPVHSLVYQAMLDLDDASKPIDPVTVAEQMRTSDTLGRLRGVGGEGYFADLMARTVTVENIGFHARLVADAAARRRLIEAAQEAQAQARIGDEDWRDAVEVGVLRAIEQRQPATAEEAGKIATRVYDGVCRRADQNVEIVGATTGVPSVDRVLRGLQPGRLYVIGGRPGDGKTALGVGMVQAAAELAGEPGYVLTLEMGREELVERMMASDARVDGDSIRVAKLSGQGPTSEWAALWKAATKLNTTAPIIVDDEPLVNLRLIRARLRRWVAGNEKRPELKGRRGIALIDYLQLVDVEREKGENPSEALGRVSRGLKLLAKELRIPVVAVSQLNRGSESRGDRRPTMADLRSSGAIEQDADVVMLLWRRDPKKAATDLLIEKNRGGAIATVPLLFLKPYTRFVEEGDEPGDVLPFEPSRAAAPGSRHPYAPDGDDDQ